jgi:hypothetical protein
MSGSLKSRSGIAESGKAVAATEGQLAPNLPPVPQPDFIVQIRKLLDLPPCMNDGVNKMIVQSLTASFQAEFPGAYVDWACAGGPDPANESAAFGVWLSPPTPFDTTAAQDLLGNSSIGRAQNETIAFYINTTLFEAAAATNFPSDPDSHTHLHKPLHLQYNSPNTIVTIVNGVDTEPVPDASFTLKITERFSGGPELGVPPQPSLDVDSSWVYDLEAFLVAIGWVVGGPWTVPLTIAGWMQAYKVNTASPPSVQGVGSAVARAVMPPSIAIPGGLKILIEYVLREQHNNGVAVDSTGMYTGGLLQPPVPRTPSVSLSGEETITVPIAGDDVQDTITASTQDMRGNLTFAWTMNGGPVQSTDPSITLSFSPGSGPFGTQDIAVKVTDEDGLSAVGTTQVFVEQKQRSPSTGDPNSPKLHPA